MASSFEAQDVEKDPREPPAPLLRPMAVHTPVVMPFAGRLGGNQEFVVNRDDASNASILQNIPDAAPGMTLAEQFDLRPFRGISLYKAAAMEGIGQFTAL